MSVYGGDSWGREAQHRKRRVDDLLIEGIDASVYKKLPNGKLACVICPNNPILDTPIMLSAHVNGSRHRAAESRRKDRELALQREICKRRRAIDASIEERRTKGKPLIDRARKAASEVISGDFTRIEAKSVKVNLSINDCGGNGDFIKMEAKHNELALQQEINKRRAIDASIEERRTKGKPLIERARKAASEVISGEVTQIEAKSVKVNLSINDCGGNGDFIEMEAKHKETVGELKSLDYRERIEKELKFTAAGWKRDGHGRWFKDENVEFDSDEEDPNIVNLSNDCGGNGDFIEMEAKHKEVVGEATSLDYRERIERELKFMAAGWKHDSHGRWFKDENVEFDSDEEDPNIVLN